MSCASLLRLDLYYASKPLIKVYFYLPTNDTRSRLSVSGPAFPTVPFDPLTSIEQRAEWLHLRSRPRVSLLFSFCSNGVRKECR
jgi:hypothetical protein